MVTAIGCDLGWKGSRLAGYLFARSRRLRREGDRVLRNLGRNVNDGLSRCRVG